MNLRPLRILGIVAALSLLWSCNAEHQAGPSSGSVVRVGSKNFTESIVVAEIYAQALEAAGIKVERKFNLGSTQIAMAALRRGDIDLYPEYTGTGLIDVLHQAPIRDEAALYAKVQTEFAKQHLTWLHPSPMNDSQGLATTAAISKKYHLKTLRDCSKLAPQLRFGSIPEFLSRADALPGLQKFYGGFKFKDIKTYDIGLKYQALQNGGADVVTAFTTDGLIASMHLVLLADDKHFWPPYHVAPVVRDDTLKKTPEIATALDAISAKITDDAARSMNYAVDGQHQEAADVAAAFLKKNSH